MEAEDIVEAFNDLIKEHRERNKYITANGRCIVHRQILPHKTIKSLLDIFITVYFVTDASKEELFKVRHRLQSNVDVNVAMTEATKTMTYNLMSIIGTHTFNQLLTDNFTGYDNLKL